MNYDLHAKNLASGITVQFRPKGNSMTPRIKSGELVTVVPLEQSDGTRIEINTGDVVFCRVAGNYYVHLVKAVKIVGQDEKRYLIGNNKGRTNGWTATVYGKVVTVEP